MNLENIDLLSLQTSYMKQDPTTIAFCAALNPKFKQLADEVKYCLIYSRINDLDDAALDELAWEMHVDWYDANVDIEIKKQLIKNSIKVHRYRGTPQAVEDLIKTYFGDGYVKEWFDYSGQPFMFKVYTSNPAVTAELANRFTMVLNSVKRKSAQLEEIIITLSGNMDVYYGSIVHTGDFLTIRQVK